MTSKRVTVTARCEDLLLAQECIADLRAAGFRDQVSIVSSTGRSRLRGTGLTFGRLTGGPLGRRILAGYLLGGAVGAVIAAGQASAAGYPASIAAAIGGAVVGGTLALIYFKLRKPKHSVDEDDAGLMLRVETDEAAARLAQGTLRNSTCSNVQLVS